MIVLRKEKKRLRTYRGVVNDDIIAGHIAMENVFFQVLDERALQSHRHKREGKLNDFRFYPCLRRSLCCEKKLAVIEIPPSYYFETNILNNA